MLSFSLQEGTQEEFGDSWHYPLPGDMCVSNETVVGPGDPCENYGDVATVEANCAIITNTSGKHAAAGYTCR